MASILTLPKNIEDIEEPTLMEEDWYEMRLVKDPQVKPNAVLKAFMKERNLKDAERALALAIEENYVDDDEKHPGMNWVLSMRVVHQDPMINGRAFTSWVQLPNSADKHRIDINGQTIEDSKLTKMTAVLNAFHGKEVSGNEAYLEAGMTAQYYIIQDDDFRNPDKKTNSIDMNTDPVQA